MLHHSGGHTFDTLQISLRPRQHTNISSAHSKYLNVAVSLAALRHLSAPKVLLYGCQRGWVENFPTHSKWPYMPRYVEK